MYPDSGGADFTGFFIYLGITALWIVIAVSVYNDAESRGMSGVVWALVVFFFGIIALLIYLLARGSNPVRSTQSHSYNTGVYRGPGIQQTQATQAPAVTADADFTDPHIDNLIQQGDFREARKQVSEMLQMAKEMSDQRGIANYRKYEGVISRAAAQGRTKQPRY